MAFALVFWDSSVFNGKPRVNIFRKPQIFQSKGHVYVLKETNTDIHLRTAWGKDC